MELNPPRALRADVLAAARRRRPPGRPHPDVVPAGPLAAFRGQAGAVAALLAEVPADGWDRPVVPYPWTVHGLVGHLVGVERYVGGLLGLWPFTPVCSEHDHRGLTEPDVAATAAAEPGATVAEWSALVAAVGTHVERLGTEALHRRVDLHGYPFTLGGVMVLRAFELWTHADDVRRALGRPVEAPAPAELAAMAHLSLRTLFAAVLVTAPHQSGRAARFVLTGPGGGVWRLGAEGVEPDVRVVVDIVDFCRLAARRLDPDELAADIAGDVELARDLFAAARLMAA
jgi:uncharacterized protein (TIGR03083 family)